jgi:NDP-sugar pyrophosphorylase family protein
MSSAAGPLTAIVLVGGLGTRLGALTGDLPKPMVEVGGRPFLEHVVRHLAACGVERAILASGHRADAVEAHFGDGGGFGLRIEHSREPEPLGTGGALRLAAARLPPSAAFLALNGDSVLAIDPVPLLAELDGADGALALREVPDAGRYGSVELAPDGRISAFREKATGPARPGLINAGVYALRRSVLDDLPVDVPSSLERDVLPRLALSGRLRGRPYDAYFVDIGIPETLLALRADPSELLAALGGPKTSC